MSQNKTVFPGLEPESGKRGEYAQSTSYSRPQGKNSRQGTVYPGMQLSSEAPAVNKITSQDNHKPISGFLYSISRTGVGEFWPVYLGPNIIGSSSECDIILNEATVSQKHAILHINKMKNPEKIEATICDSQSTNGTMVNGNSVSVVRPLECFNGDVIAIGENYELLLILIDVKGIGLKVSENFIPVEADEEPVFMSLGSGQRETRDEEDFPPHFYGPDSSYGHMEHTDSTVGIDSSVNGEIKKGGTKGM